MKKILFMLGCAAVAFTSCVKSEVVEVADTRVIGFEPFVNKTTKTAYQIQQAGAKAEATKDNLYQFWVFGYENDTPNFDGTDEKAKVYWDTSLQGFTYTNHQIWKLNDTYNFAAYSNGNCPLIENANENSEVSSSTNLKVKYEKGTDSVTSKLTFKGYTVGEQDLLAAIIPPVTPVKDSDIAPVSFPFQHMLACVQIAIVNSSSDFYLRVNNITLNASKTGDCVYSLSNSNSTYTKTIAWTNLSNGAYTFNSQFPIENTENGDGSYIAPGAQANMYCFVIPQPNANLTAQVDLRTYHKSSGAYEATQDANQTLTANFNIPETLTGHSSWQPGYQYIYKAELSGTAHYIHFRVDSVENWNKTTVSTTSANSN